MSSRRSDILSFVAFLLVFIVGLAVNGLLGLSGFESVYRDSLIRQYNVQGEFIKTRIESSLSLGKKLTLIPDQVQSLFYEALDRSDGISHIYVTDKNELVLYSTRSVMAQNLLPFECFNDDEETSVGTTPYTVTFGDSEYICIPLYDSNSIEGCVVIEFPRQLITSYILKMTRKIVGLGAVLLGICSVFYLLFYLLLKRYSWSETFITVFLLLVSQIAFSWNAYSTYNNDLSFVFNKNMTVMAKSVAEDLQKPLEYIDGYNELSRVPQYLGDRIAGNPQCSEIYITDSSYSVLTSSTSDPDVWNTGTRLDKNDTDLTFFPLSSTSNSDYLVFRLNRPMINEILRDMALDSGTIIIVALLFSFILKDFFILMQNKKSITKQVSEMTPFDEANALRLIKVSTFFFMFAAFETLSFIPLFIKEIFAKSPGILAGIDPNTAISLPVSSYMLGIMTAMFITIFALKNLSIRKRYIIMSLMFIAGSACTIISPDMLILIIARFIAGFGFGGVLLSTSSLVIAYTSDRTRSQGFGTNAAASASASIASISVGGVISNKFGYEAGIIVSIVFALFFLFFSLFCIKEQKASSATSELQPVKKSLSAKQFFRVFFSRHILSYILCINIPFQLIYVGLFQFLLPLYMSETLLLSQGNIGRILCIFSIVSLAASSVSKFSDKFKNDKVLIAFGAVCVGVIMIIFNFWQAGGFIIFFALMFAMGIDNVFIDAIEEVYIESGQISDVDEENILQSYKTIEKVISVAIPTVTSTIITMMAFSGSMLVIGAYSLIGAVLFIILGKNGRQQKKGNGGQK
ncbi:MAG: MFS transporter [Treponemataceae bacterium]|nr:MFS transporter [Treponemataceae bacterium]